MSEDPRQGVAAARPPRQRRGVSRGAVVAAIVALAVLATIVLAIVLIAGDDKKEIENGKATEVSAKELRSFAKSSSHAVYWAGPTPGFKLELTKTSRGNVYVRYLPEDVAIGNRSALYTTLGSYPIGNAFAVATKAGQERGASKANAPGGGIAVARRNRPRSTYLAYPGGDVLVEVYAADAKQARALALSGRVGVVR